MRQAFHTVVWLDLSRQIIVHAIVGHIVSCTASAGLLHEAATQETAADPSGGVTPRGIAKAKPVKRAFIEKSGVTPGCDGCYSVKKGRFSRFSTVQSVVREFTVEFVRIRRLRKTNGPELMSHPVRLKEVRSHHSAA